MRDDELMFETFREEALKFTCEVLDLINEYVQRVPYSKVPEKHIFALSAYLSVKACAALSDISLCPVNEESREEFLEGFFQQVRSSMEPFHLNQPPEGKNI